MSVEPPSFPASACAAPPPERRSGAAGLLARVASRGSRFALAGALAGGGAGLVDGIGVWMGAPGGGALSAASCVGAGLALGPWAGLLAAAVTGWLGAGPAPGEREAWPGRLLSMLPVSAVLGVPFFLLAGVPLERFASRGFQLLALSILALGLALLSLPLSELARRWMEVRIGAALPVRGGSPGEQPGSRAGGRRSLLWALGLGMPAAAAAAICYGVADIPTALGWRPLLVALAWLAALLLAAWGLSGWSWGRLAWSSALAWSVGLALMVGPMVDGEVKAAVMSQGLLSPAPMRAIWSALDGDGDGFAGSLGGGDCDDGDPAIHPLAVDALGNGIDEDCSGKDAEALGATHEVRALGPMAWPEGLERPRHLVLITIEALRSDAIDARTPNLLALSRSARRFDRASSAGPATHLSLMAMMTGRYPSRLKWDLGARPPRALGEPSTLARLLRRRGWTADAFVTQWVHRNVSGLGRSFDRFEQASEKGGSSQALLDKALSRIGEQGAERPGFLWVHFVEPHWPHESGQTETLESGYRAELATVDARVGRLLEALRSRPGWDRALVIVTGDHGEALGAHGVQTHGVTLYEAEVRVPLLIQVPGLPAGVHGEVVSGVDLAPTALDLLGIEGEGLYDGRSLAPLMVLGEPLGARPVFSESYNPLRPPQVWLTVTWGRWKLLRRSHEGRDELYDVVADPGEVEDLSGAGVAELEALKAEAARFAQGGTW